MSGKKVPRPTHVYSMPLADGASILHPQLAVITFGLSRTLDIGALCYSQRDLPEKLIGSRGRKVVPESLVQSRIHHVRKLIDHISAISATSGLRKITMHNRFGRFIAFIHWADLNMWPDVLSGVDAATPALHAYIEHVRERVTRNEITLNTGSIQQSSVVQILEEYLGVEHLSRGLNLLKRDEKIIEATVPPTELAQGRILALCNSLFDGACELVLDRLPYPYALNLPRYLGFPNDRLWLFPTKLWFKTPAMIAASPKPEGYDFVEGRLSTADEVRDQFQKKIYAARAVVSQVKTRIENANSDYNHASRWLLAVKAQNSFLIMFLAATGMNWTPAIELPWSGEYEVTPTKQGFRSVKWRANGRSVSFELPISFLPKFKRFLSLRTYLLQGKSCDYLFFHRRIESDDPTQVRSDLHGTYQMLRGIDPGLSLVFPRAWRAAKSDWLVRHTDPSTAASVLQNSEQTVLKHYAEGSETLHHEEMGKFLSEVAIAVLAPGETLQDATPRSVGVCTSFGAPVASAAPARIRPDCNAAEGCLFCEKFRVHADETDTRKLLSCRYAINLTAPLSDSDEAFNELLRPVLERIDELVFDISTRDPTMVERIKAEVNDDGELDPYWAGKVEMLMTLGLI